jgi:hypothetical protein
MDNMYIDISFQRYISTDERVPAVDSSVVDTFIGKSADNSSAELKKLLSEIHGENAFINIADSYYYAVSVLTRNGYGYYAEFLSPLKWPFLIKAVSLISLCAGDIFFMADVYCKIAEKMLDKSPFHVREQNSFTLECDKDELNGQLNFFTLLSDNYRMFKEAFELSYELQIYEAEKEFEASDKSKDTEEYITYKKEYYTGLYQQGAVRVKAIESRIERGLFFYKDKSAQWNEDTIKRLSDLCGVEDDKVESFVRSYGAKQASAAINIVEKAINILESPLLQVNLGITVIHGIYAPYDEQFIIFCHESDPFKLYAQSLNGTSSFIMQTQLEIKDIACGNGFLVVSFGTQVAVNEVSVQDDQLSLKKTTFNMLPIIYNKAINKVSAYGKYYIMFTDTGEALFGKGIKGKSTGAANNKYLADFFKTGGMGYGIKISYNQLLIHGDTYILVENDADILISSQDDKKVIKRAHNSRITGICYYDFLLYTCSADGFIRAWDLKSKRRCFTIKTELPLASITVTELFIIALAQNGKAVFYSRKGIIIFAEGDCGIEWLAKLTGFKQRKVIEHTSLKRLSKR